MAPFQAGRPAFHVPAAPPGQDYRLVRSPVADMTSGSRLWRYSMNLIGPLKAARFSYFQVSLKAQITLRALGCSKEPIA